MSALIMFRSLTRAERAVHILAARGIPSAVIRAPRGLSERGCAFAASLGERYLREALGVLEREGVAHEKAYLPRADGSYREAEI